MATMERWRRFVEEWADEAPEPDPTADLRAVCHCFGFLGNGRSDDKQTLASIVSICAAITGESPQATMDFMAPFSTDAAIKQLASHPGKVRDPITLDGWAALETYAASWLKSLMPDEGDCMNVAPTG